MGRPIAVRATKPSTWLSSRAWWRRVPMGLVIFMVHEAVVLLGTAIPYRHASFRYTEQNQSFPHQAHFIFQWDSLWYLNIARHGYSQIPHVPHLAGTAFFPWLPLLIHVFGAWGAWTLTQTAFGVALWRLPHLLKNLGLSSPIALWSTILLALNSTMVYDSMLYAEPWTLMFTILSIELGVRARWSWAALFGALAATTQATGILVGAFPLTVCLFSLVRHQGQRIRGALLWGIGPLIGMASYEAYLGWAFHQPLLFASIQHTPFWHADWQWPWLQWIHAWSGGARLKTLALGMTLLGLGGIVLMIRPLRNEWTAAFALYGCLGLLVALSFTKAVTPYHSSLRIASIFFPLYIGLARLPRIPLLAVLALFGGLGITGTVLVSHGWWFQ